MTDPNTIKARLYAIADEMRNMASMSDYFADNPYQKERAARMMELGAEIAALIDTEDAPEAIRAAFMQQPWVRISPWIGAEAFVLDDQERVLLIQRRDNGRWCLPGGLAEVGRTFSESALIELWEEAGMRGQVERVLGVFDTSRDATNPKMQGTHIVYHVTADDLTPAPGVEALDAGFFAREALDDLPLHPGHERRIPESWDALALGVTAFDPADSAEIDLSDFQRPDVD
jgi:8-oxo-dGTP pyrophosphatase MutT (NUDIX family)